MNVCYKGSNKIKRKKLQIKEHKKRKRRGNLKETKIYLNWVNITRIFLKEVKKFKEQDNIDKMKTIRNIYIIQNKIDFPLNRNRSKCPNNFKLLNIFLYSFMLFINLFILLCQCNRAKILFHFSELTLKVKGIGEITILSNYFYQRYKPNQIYINNSLENITENRYYFINSEINTIRMEWNYKIENTSSMFRDCNKIIEIDLSNFDTSQVKEMSFMFYNCDLLKELNLSNFDTSQVTKMERMFSFCSKLTSLNLNNFNTSNVKNMKHMFHGCSSLCSLALSNFDTSKVIYMNGMFAFCYALNILNLSNFYTSQVKNISSIFKGCSNLTLLDI